MNLLWTWGGKFFGYREGNLLWTYKGRHVGIFNGDEVYDSRGRYLGEVYNDRLITHLEKKHWGFRSFAPYASRIGIVPSVDYVGYVMLAGYEDFPAPDELG